MSSQRKDKPKTEVTFIRGGAYSNCKPKIFFNLIYITKKCRLPKVKRRFIQPDTEEFINGIRLPNMV